MTKTIRLFLLFLIAVAFSSCFDDKGNYDYKEIGNLVLQDFPRVTDNNNRFVCLENELVKLNPNWVYPDGMSADDYEFVWHRYPQDAKGEYNHYEQGDTIGFAANLEYQVVDLPRDYYVLLRATNKITGAITELKFEFIISSVTGWMVLDEKAGKGDLQIIRDADVVSGGDGRIVKDYFSANNGGKKIEDGSLLGYSDTKKYLYVFEKNGGYVFNPFTYKEIDGMTYGNLFVSQPENEVPEAQFLGNNKVEVLLNDGQAYVAWWMSFGVTGFAPAVIEGDYLVAPNIAPIYPLSAKYTSVLFDMQNNRFFTIDKFGGVVAPVSAGGAFNVGAIDPSLQYVFMGDGKDSETCLLMKDDAGVPTLFRANFLEEEPVALEQVKLTGLTDITNAKEYAFGTRGSFMFYATDNKIYLWRFGKEEATEFFTVGAGEKIEQIKMYVNSDDSENNGKILFIATSKGNEGKVYKAMFSEMSGLLQGTPQEYTGFGLIKDMFLKK